MAEDRRVRRTRKQLRDALLQLMSEKPYDQITVRDILERADFGRATFYAHFRDKDDLLISGFEDVRETLRTAMAAYERREHAIGGDALAALFAHVDNTRFLYRSIVGSRAGQVLLRYAQAEISALTREHFQHMVHATGATVPVDVLAEYVSGALIGVLTWWLRTETPYTADELAATFERITMPTLEVGLGLGTSMERA